MKTLKGYLDSTCFLMFEENARYFVFYFEKKKHVVVSYRGKIIIVLSDFMFLNEYLPPRSFV